MEHASNVASSSPFLGCFDLLREQRVAFLHHLMQFSSVSVSRCVILPSMSYDLLGSLF